MQEGALLDDGFVIPLMAGTILFIVLSVFIIFFVILYSRAQLKFRLERQQFQQALLESEIEIRKETLHSVARDLHDNLGQIASLIKINMNLLQAEIQGENQYLEESKTLLSRLIQDMRQLTNELYAQDLSKIDLSDMIRKDLDRVNTTGVIQIAFHDETQNLSLSPEIALFLYRMSQEMIHNILKHSEAVSAKINLYNTGQSLVLKVQDDGRGFNPNQNPGNGLNTIRDRCKIIGAKCDIQSLKNKGTFIEVIYPLQNHVHPLKPSGKNSPGR